MTLRVAYISCGLRMLRSSTPIWSVESWLGVSTLILPLDACDYELSRGMLDMYVAALLDFLRWPGEPTHMLFMPTGCSWRS